ncbi:hypothetical protein HDK77DRAFT_423886 [Phyllosticta capitalensis]
MILPLVIVLLSLAPLSLARQWYDVHFGTSPPYPPPQFFVELAGQMIVPRLPHAGEYYIFPAMQPWQGGGIYQSVLDGRSGKWSFVNGWCCAKGFPCSSPFSSKWDHAGDPRAGWTNVIKHESTGTTKTTHVNLGGKFFNQVLFGIELYNQHWDFGWLEFKNIVIRSNGRDTKWCTTPISDTAIFEIAKPVATVDRRGVTCFIAALVQKQPSHPQPP